MLCSCCGNETPASWQKWFIGAFRKGLSIWSSHTCRGSPLRLKLPVASNHTCGNITVDKCRAEKSWRATRCFIPVVSKEKCRATGPLTHPQCCCTAWGLGCVLFECTCVFRDGWKGLEIPPETPLWLLLNGCAMSRKSIKAGRRDMQAGHPKGYSAFAPKELESSIWLRKGQF